MQDNDSCQRFIFIDNDVRGELVNLSESYQSVLAGNAYPAAIGSLLGEFLAASVLLTTTIKFKGRLVLQARSEGEVPLIMAECTSDRGVRGIARFAETLSDDSFAVMLHRGTLAITIEPEKGEPYQGIVPLDNGNLAACLEDYFVRSEQLSTQVHLVVGQGRCAGLLLQQLPAQLLRDRELRQENWNNISQLAATVTDEELLDLDNESLLFRLFNQHRVKLFNPDKVRYHCSCSRERTARALFVLGIDEVMDIVAEQGGIEMHCEFCGKEYNYGGPELALLFENPSGDAVH